MRQTHPLRLLFVARCCSSVHSCRMVVRYLILNNNSNPTTIYFVCDQLTWKKKPKNAKHPNSRLFVNFTFAWLCQPPSSPLPADQTSHSSTCRIFLHNNNYYYFHSCHLFHCHLCGLGWWWMCNTNDWCQTAVIVTCATQRQSICLENQDQRQISFFPFTLNAPQKEWKKNNRREHKGKRGNCEPRDRQWQPPNM